MRRPSRPPCRHVCTPLLRRCVPTSRHRFSQTGGNPAAPDRLPSAPQPPPNHGSRFALCRAAGRRGRSLRSACGSAAGARPRLLTLDARARLLRAGAHAPPLAVPARSPAGGRALRAGTKCILNDRRHGRRAFAPLWWLHESPPTVPAGDCALPVNPRAPTPRTLHSAPRGCAKPSPRSAPFRARAAARFARLLRGLAPRAFSPRCARLKTEHHQRACD
jgi:hypothetical protein